MARIPSLRAHKGEESSQEVNLLPSMSVICILIPMLVYAFSFFEIKVQPVAAPRMGAGRVEKEGEKQKKPLNLTVLITDKGFVLKQEESIAVGSPSLNIEKKTFRDKDGNPVLDYNYPELYNKLIEIKKEFKDEMTINIGADPNITWEFIARTIDVSRVRLEKDDYREITELSEAKEKVDSEGKPEFLFPQVVFVVAE